MVDAPSLMAASTTLHKKSISERYPSSAENSISSAKFLAKRIERLACSNTSSGDMRNFTAIWSGLVAKKAWIRFALAAFNASEARVISLSLARANEQTIESFTAAATAEIA